MMRRRSFFSALLAVSLLSGCASTRNIDAGYQFSDSGKGLVMFSVTQEKGEQAFSGRYYGSMIEVICNVRAKGKDEYLLSAHSLDNGLFFDDGQFKDVFGRVHVRELPAGRYEIFDWTLLYNFGAGTASIKHKNPPMPLSFEVEAGKAIYIGNIHTHFKFGTFLFIPRLEGGYPEVRNEAERDLKVILESYPQLQGRIQVNPLPVQARWEH